MQRQTVGQRDHAQIAPDLTNPHPVPDAPILGLDLAPNRILQSRLAPLQANVGPFFQDVIPEVVGHRLHDRMLPLFTQSVKQWPRTLFEGREHDVNVVAMRSALSRAHVLEQPLHEGLAQRHLLQRHVFVGLVRLLDRARAADDGGDARLLEQSTLRDIGYFGR